MSSVIRVKVANKYTEVLMDTGAAVSCISCEFANDLGVRILPLGSNAPRNLVAADCGVIRMKGETHLNLDVNGHVFSHTFYVMEPCSAKIICGSDFMIENGVNIDYDRGIASFRVNRSSNVCTSVPFVCRKDYLCMAVLTDECKVYPGQEVFLSVKPKFSETRGKRFASSIGEILWANQNYSD
jgi:gag-polyprotein putative aspartyl protease